MCQGLALLLNVLSTSFSNNYNNFDFHSHSVMGTIRLHTDITVLDAWNNAKMELKWQQSQMRVRFDQTLGMFWYAYILTKLWVHFDQNWVRFGLGTF